MVQFDVRLTLSREEIFDGVQRAELRRASKGRLIIQTVVLALVFVWALAAFLADSTHPTMSLVIAIAAVGIGVAMWVVPRWQMNSIADDAANSGKAAHLWVLDDGVDFGEEIPEKAYLSYDRLHWYLPREGTLNTVVWRLPEGDVIVVPRRLLTEEQWDTLLSKAVK